MSFYRSEQIDDEKELSDTEDAMPETQEEGEPGKSFNYMRDQIIGSLIPVNAKSHLFVLGMSQSNGRYQLEFCAFGWVSPTTRSCQQLIDQFLVLVQCCDTMRGHKKASLLVTRKPFAATADRPPFKVQLRRQGLTEKCLDDIYCELIIDLIICFDLIQEI